MLSQTQLEFLAQVTAPAIATDRDLACPRSVTVAQAILESTARVNGIWTWGGSVLFRLANNPFGIKFTNPDPYMAFDVETHEIVNGKLTPELAGFEHYPDLTSAFKAHALLVANSTRYRPAWNVRSDWQAFAIGIMRCGYSTDRPEEPAGGPYPATGNQYCRIPGCVHYAGKLIGIVKDYHLNDDHYLSWYALGKEPQS